MSNSRAKGLSTFVNTRHDEQPRTGKSNLILCCSDVRVCTSGEARIESYITFIKLWECQQIYSHHEVIITDDQDILVLL